MKGVGGRPRGLEWNRAIRLTLKCVKNNPSPFVMATEKDKESSQNVVESEENTEPPLLSHDLVEDEAVATEMSRSFTSGPLGPDQPPAGDVLVEPPDHGDMMTPLHVNDSGRFQLDSGIM